MTPTSVDDRKNITTKKSDMSSFVQSHVRTPPPPGFHIDDKATFYGSDRAGAGSAPPLSFATSFTTALDDLIIGHPENLRLMLRPTNGSSNNLEESNANQRTATTTTSAPSTAQKNNGVKAVAQSDRTSSYVNLAAVLGEGLAESMGDSLEEVGGNLKIIEPNQNTVKVDVDFNNTRHNTKKMDFNIDMEIDNYSRQSRHSLTRLVGSSGNGFMIDSRNFLKEKITQEFCNGTNDLTSLRTLEDRAAAVAAANVRNIGAPITFDNVNSTSRIGTSSAPPQFFDNDFSQFGLGANSTVLRQQTAMSLQQRASELRSLQKQRDSIPPSPAGTPLDFSSDVSSAAMQHSRSDTRMPLLLNESKTLKQLRPFVWSSSSSTMGDNFSSPSDQPSRALAIFGVSQLPISEIRSTCEAFGSLLYFRSEFSISRNVIFIAYHDLRSACHASKELKNYLHGMASSSLDDSNAPMCKDDLHVMFSVSLLSSSERDESSLVFSNLPYGVDKEQVFQIMASFGAILSISQHLDEGEMSPTSGPSYLVKFYDIQDANHCILEIQSTKPWGHTSSIKTQKRIDSDRKRGQDLLSLISQWRMSSNYSPSNVTNSATTSQTQSPATVSSVSSRNPADDKFKSNPNCNVSTSSTQSTTPPISYLPQAPQLMIGPDGQYSYVVVQPQAYGTSPPQYIQQATIVPSHVPSHVPSTHQPHQPPPHAAPPQPQYVFDGHNYWLHQPPLPPREPHHVPNSHMTGYHHVQQNQPVTYQVLPMYSSAPAPSQNIQQHDPSRNGHNQNFAHNPPKVGIKENVNNNSDTKQRNNLDIEAVKQGWDSRTSLMIRNIPNKYTRSMLLSEFKESNHGPGTIDFFYLPIDFRNKCNRGYAFVNFVNYRDIVTFYDAYNGKGWKTFKSDKICEITYARIQGKSSMMKRFQNSALMDKDPEYRPVVFNANGEVYTSIGEA